MGFFDVLLHIANFLAPAMFVSLLLTTVMRWRATMRLRWLPSFAIIFIAGCAALLGGLVYFGNDGKMGSYALMCMACAGTALWLSRPKTKI